MYIHLIDNRPAFFNPRCGYICKSSRKVQAARSMAQIRHERRAHRALLKRHRIEPGVTFGALRVA